MTNGRSSADPDGITHHSLIANGFSVEGFSVDESILDAACKKLKGGSALDMTASRETVDREIPMERAAARNRSYSPSDLKDMPQTQLRVGSERPSRLYRSGRRGGDALYKQLQQAHGGVNTIGWGEYTPRKGIVGATGEIQEKLSELRKRVSHLAERCTTLEAASTLCSQVRLSEENALAAEHERMMKELASLQQRAHVQVGTPKADCENSENVEALKSYITSLTAETVSTASSPAYSRAPSPSPVKYDTGYYSSLSTPISAAIDSAYAIPRTMTPSSELRYHCHSEPQQRKVQSEQKAIELDPPSWFKPPPGSLEVSLAPPPIVSSVVPVSPSGVDFNFPRSGSHATASMSSWHQGQAELYAGHSGTTYGNMLSFGEADLYSGGHAGTLCRASSYGASNSTVPLASPRQDSSWQSHWQGNGSASYAPWQSNSCVPMHPGVAALQWSAPGVSSYLPGQMFDQPVR